MEEKIDKFFPSTKNFILNFGLIFETKNFDYR
jgi:hypothetical protein